MSICRFCKIELNNENWLSSSQKSNNYVCKKCRRVVAKKKYTLRSDEQKQHQREAQKVYRRNNGGKVGKQQREYNKTEAGKLVVRRKELKKSFGITIEQYDEMLKQQNGKCFLCGKPEIVVQRGVVIRLAVDHNHKTGEIRHLLCQRCNFTVGVIENNKGIVFKILDTYLSLT